MVNAKRVRSDLLGNYSLYVGYQCEHLCTPIMKTGKYRMITIWVVKVALYSEPIWSYIINDNILDITDTTEQSGFPSLYVL